MRRYQKPDAISIGDASGREGMHPEGLLTVFMELCEPPHFLRKATLCQPEEVPQYEAHEHQSTNPAFLRRMRQSDSDRNQWPFYPQSTRPLASRTQSLFLESSGRAKLSIFLPKYGNR